MCGSRRPQGWSTRVPGNTDRLLSKLAKSLDLSRDALLSLSMPRGPAGASVQLLAEGDAGAVCTEATGLRGHPLQLHVCDHQAVFKPLPCFLTRREV